MSSDTTADVVTEAGSSPAKAAKSKKSRRRPMPEVLRGAPTFTDRFVTPMVLAPIIFLALSAGGYRWANSPTLVMLIDHGACALVLACYGVYLSFTKQSIGSELAELKVSSKERLETAKTRYGLLAARYMRRMYVLHRTREQREYFKRKYKEAQVEITRVLGLNAEAERKCTEAYRTRDFNAVLAERLQSGSIMGDHDAWWDEFVYEDGSPVTRKGATHWAALVVINRGCKGLPIRAPDAETPQPYVIRNAGLGIEIAVARSPINGTLTVKLVETRWSSDLPAIVEVPKVENVGLLVHGGGAGLLIRASAFEVYKDVAIVNERRFRNEPFKPYFVHFAIQTAGFVRKQTMQMAARPSAPVEPKAPDAT